MGISEGCPSVSYLRLIFLQLFSSLQSSRLHEEMHFEYEIKMSFEYDRQESHLASCIDVLSPFPAGLGACVYTFP